MIFAYLCTCFLHDINQSLQYEQISNGSECTAYGGDSLIGRQPLQHRCPRAARTRQRPCVAPNGKTVLFGVSYENLAENNANNDLYLVEIDSEKAPVKITDTPKSESSAVWIAGGDKIAFIYPDADGNAQMWTMNPDGTDRVQATEHPAAFRAFFSRPTKLRLWLSAMLNTPAMPATSTPIFPKQPAA